MGDRHLSIKQVNEEQLPWFDLQNYNNKNASNYSNEKSCKRILNPMTTMEQ